MRQVALGRARLPLPSPRIGRWPAAPRVRPAAQAGWDAALYGAAALVAGVGALVDQIPLQREWARLAFAPYAVGAVVALLLALRWRRRPAHRPLRVRAILAALVLTGVLVAPLSLEVGWRAGYGDRLHVQSEVLLIERGAANLLHGHDPYTGSYGYGLLRSYPPGVWKHIPYLPAIFAFGMPRAALGASPLTDARVGFAVVSLAAAVLALRLSGASREARLRILMVLLILPTGARYLTGGGDDIAVLSLLLLTVVLEQRGRPVAAGLVAGIAAATKQTAWLALPLLALAAWDANGRRAGWRFIASAGAVVAVVVAPFALWNFRALVNSAVLFPLGLAGQPTIARGLTVGQLLARPFPQARGAIAVGLGAVVVATGVLLATRWWPVSVSVAARHAGVLIALAVLLAPAGRLGYLIYPLNLLLWSVLLREDRLGSWVAVPSRSGGGTRAGADRALSDQARARRPGGGAAAGDDGRGPR
jgi:Glycosyltransferase family 87